MRTDFQMFEIKRFTDSIHVVWMYVCGKQSRLVLFLWFHFIQANEILNNYLKNENCFFSCKWYLRSLNLNPAWRRAVIICTSEKMPLKLLTFTSFQFIPSNLFKTSQLRGLVVCRGNMMLENQSSMMLIVRTARRTTQGENLLNRDGIMSSLIQCIHESTVT